MRLSMVCPGCGGGGGLGGGGAGFDMRFSANISSQSCFVINFQR